MAGGELMVEERSLARIIQKSTDQPHILLDGLQSHSCTPNLQDVLWSSYPMPLAFRSPCHCSLTPTARLVDLQTNLWTSSRPILTCGQVSLSKNWTSRSQSIARPRKMVTSPIKRSPGRSQKLSNFNVTFKPTTWLLFLIFH